MRRAGLFGGSLLLIAFLAGAGAAVAQEIQFDTKALDNTDAGAPAPKRKGKKAVAPVAPAEAQQQPAQGVKGGANRQFGELEGWSPGKEPPKPKDKYDPEAKGSSSGGKAPVSVTPSGNMNVGLPF
jgi:Tfp pilus assembly protein FimV